MQLLRHRSLSIVLLLVAFMCSVQSSSAQSASVKSSSAQGASAKSSSAQGASAKNISARSGDDLTSWPRIVKGASNPDSKLLLDLAKTAFHSQAPYVYSAGNDVRKKHTSLKLWFTDFGVDPLAPAVKPASTDGAAENDATVDAKQIEFDPTFFVMKEHVGSSTYAFLQKQSLSGLRFVVKETPFNWQGDNFDVLTVKLADPPEKIFEMLSQLDTEHPPDSVYVYPYRVMWQRPWLVLSQKKDHVLYIDTQHPAEFMANWDVYAANKKGILECVCKIAFRPDVKKAFDLLPDGPLLALAQLLDKKVIGYPAPGSEGTMNQTPRLRNTVANKWADLILRPWAVDTPADSRAAVEDTLKKWSQASKANAAQYRQLKALYPQAQAVLAAHYEKNLGRSHKDALALAAQNMDLALRTNFNL